MIQVLFMHFSNLIRQQSIYVVFPSMHTCWMPCESQYKQYLLHQSPWSVREGTSSITSLSSNFEQQHFLLLNVAGPVACLNISLLNTFIMKAADLPSCAGGIMPTGKRAFMSQISTLEIYGVGNQPPRFSTVSWLSAFRRMWGSQSMYELCMMRIQSTPIVTLVKLQYEYAWR